MRLLATLLVVAVLLAGCAHEERWNEEYRLTGDLAEDFDDADQADLERRAAQRGATEVLFMESFPMRFDIRPLSGSDCDNLRLELQHVDYVTQVGDCARLF